MHLTADGLTPDERRAIARYFSTPAAGAPRSGVRSRFADPDHRSGQIIEI